MRMTPKASLALALLTAAGLGMTRPASAVTYTFTTLDVPGATKGTQASGVNNAGQIVGSYTDSSGHGFLETGGAYTTLNDPSATQGTFARGVNDAGQVAGYYSDSTGNHGFLETGGAYTTLDPPGAIGNTKAFGVNDAGQVAGEYRDSTAGQHGFLATPVPEFSSVGSFGVLLLTGVGGLLVTTRKRRKNA